MATREVCRQSASARRRLIHVVGTPAAVAASLLAFVFVCLFVRAQIHFEQNELLREIFGLPPAPLGPPQRFSVRTFGAAPANK